MPKRRQKKTPPRVRHLSAGPLPRRLAERHPGGPLVFSDASQLRHGGLAAVLFPDQDSEPTIATRSVPADGSNALELQAALFALGEAHRHFPDRAFTLFADKQDAVVRLNRAKTAGLAQDPALAAMAAATDLATLLAAASICWVQSHATCRGNALADQHARQAAA